MIVSSEQVDALLQANDVEVQVLADTRQLMLVFTLTYKAQLSDAVVVHGVAMILVIFFLFNMDSFVNKDLPIHGTDCEESVRR